MNLNEREKAIQKAIENTLALALEKGADEAFISASYGVQSKIAYEKGDYNLATRHEGEGLTITVHKNQASGCASINSLEPAQLEDAITKALHLATHSIPDEFVKLAPKADYISLNLPWDEKLLHLPLNQLLSLAQGFINNCLSSPKISIDSASVEHSSGTRMIANSLGMMAKEKHNSLNWSVMGMAIDGEDITSFDYLGNYSTDLESAEIKMAETAKKFSSKLLGCLGAQSGKSYKGKVLLCPALVEELLIDPLIYHIQGGNIMDGKSRWENAIGTMVANSNFTLKDQPHLNHMRGCTAFSGEGVPTQAMTVVENGQLKTHLDSIYSANRRGTKPTGNGGGLHVPTMSPGTIELKNIIAKSKGPMLIPSRFSGNIDPLNGDFSGIAKGSQYYFDGKPLGPVKEVMVSGNVFELLTGEMTLSKELEDDGGYYQLPHILVNDISVTAD
jgi:PmbA protein